MRFAFLTSSEAVLQIHLSRRVPSQRVLPHGTVMKAQAFLNSKARQLPLSEGPGGQDGGARGRPAAKPKD